MPLEGLTLNKDATSGSIVGGVSTTFNTDGVEVKNGIHLADLAETDFTVRTGITCKNRTPALQSDGTWTKAKRTIQIVIPHILADLSTSFQVARVELEFHPEATAAEILNLKLLVSQMMTDADTASFISSGSLA